MMRVQHSSDDKLLQAKLEAKFQQTMGLVNTPRKRIEGLQRKLKQIRKMMILTVHKATELARTPIWVSLQLLGKEMVDLTGAKIGMQTKIQWLTEQLDPAKDAMEDAVEARLA